MLNNNIDETILLNSSRFIKQLNYWKNKLGGEIAATRLLSDTDPAVSANPPPDIVEMDISTDLSRTIIQKGKQSDHSIYMILLTGLKCLIHLYQGSGDIIVLAPVVEQYLTRQTLNETLALRSGINGRRGFKDLLLGVRQSVLHAYENQDYPFEVLVKQIFNGQDDMPSVHSLSNVACYMKSVHRYRPFETGINGSLVFAFERSGEKLTGRILFDSGLYDRAILSNCMTHLFNILSLGLDNPEKPLSELSFLSTDERSKLIYHFNDSAYDYPADSSLVEMIGNRVEICADRVALVYENHHISYRELDGQSERLAGLLQGIGLRPNAIAALMMHRSVDMIVGMVGVVKAGGAYLPIDPATPEKRFLAMMRECNCTVLITRTGSFDSRHFNVLQNLDSANLPVFRSQPRPQIRDLDSLPFPDRSYIDMEKYDRYLGQFLVKSNIAMQATRGCPYGCAYCHKVWPRRHVFRSAENLFEEVKLYYDMGFRRFSLVDDIFNLNLKNSARFFQLIVDNGLKLQLFLLLRGDILTEDYIDLMAAAGLTHIRVSLETASPRLQKLIGKKLNIEKLHRNLEYIIGRYPQVIVDLNIMHGFPSETTEEALLTLAFVKSLKWLHFPFFNTVRIYPNTDMEKIAMQMGISREAIHQSVNLDWNELADTLPFDKNFTLECQTDLLKNYFLSRERLLAVLPHQMKILREDQLLQKYNSYLLSNFKGFDELLDFFGVTRGELGDDAHLYEDYDVTGMNKKIQNCFGIKKKSTGALRVLLLDLSMVFGDGHSEVEELNEVPLGLMYLTAYLDRLYGDRVHIRIAKSRVDFNSATELGSLLEEFEPELVGLRTMTNCKDFFHRLVSLIRQSGFDGLLIGGGPYATSDCEAMLQDPNLDLAVLGEGEITFGELVGQVLKYRHQRVPQEVLENIAGIALLRKTGSRFGTSVRHVIALDEFRELNSLRTREKSRWVATAGDLAYVIFTSGSTGSPKGTLVEHGNAMNVVNWFARTHGLTEGTQVLQTANYTFDPSVNQVFGSLISGATLHLIAHETLIDMEKLRRYIRKCHINIINTVPIILEGLLVNDEFLPSIRAVLSGAERLSEDLKNNIIGQGYRLYNQYGPTETTIDALVGRCSTDPVNLGTPIDNVKCYVLSRYLSPVPVGVPGELYIGGKGVTRGYLNHVELTSQRFVTLSAAAGQRIYRTGDRVRWLNEGTVEFLGRIDRQLKIRGFRVEPAEIERHFSEQPEVREAVVLPGEDQNGAGHLYAYLVLNSELTGHSLTETEDADSGLIRGEKSFGRLRWSDIDPDAEGSIGEQPLLQKAGTDEGEESYQIRCPQEVRKTRLAARADALARTILTQYDDRFKLNPEERTRYKRQLILNGWNIGSQEKLKSKTVFVVGAGGIGSPMLQQLALLGIGRIFVCDFDEVELSNLNRQVLHVQSRLGMNKARSALLTINRINPHVEVEVIEEKLTRNNMTRLVGDADVIFDCMDDMESKFALSEYAAVRGIPHIFTGMMEINSFAAIFNPPDTPCFHCLYDREKMVEISELRRLMKSYQKKPFPVLAPSLFAITGFACNEAVKLLLGVENPAYNKFFFFNQYASPEIVDSDGYKQMTYFFSDHFRHLCREQGFLWEKCWRGRILEELEIRPDPDCPVCSPAALASLRTTGQVETVSHDDDPDSPIEVPTDSSREPGTVALMLEGEERAAALLGVLKAGKTVVGLLPGLSEDEKIRMLDDAGVRIFLSDQAQLPQAYRLRDRVNSNIKIIRAAEAEADSAGELPAVSVDPQVSALITFRTKNSRDSEVEALKKRVATFLPDFMFPQHLVVLDKIPRTRNGKVDIQALKLRNMEQEGQPIAPSSELERNLATIWGEVLNVDSARIGMDADFFELGGHSLKATMLISRIHKAFNVRVPLAELFNGPSLRQLCGYIRSTMKEEFAPIEPAENREYYPLSSVQKRLYFLQLMGPESTVYNMPQVVSLAKEVNKEQLERAFAALIRRHKSLRASIVEVDGQPVQVIRPDVPFVVDEIEIDDDERLPGDLVRPFDLAEAPFFRAVLIRRRHQVHLLFADMHHIISDALSNALMVSELESLFNGVNLPPLRIQYCDYTIWQRNSIDRQAFRLQEKFWLAQMAGNPAILNLPLDYPRPANQSFAGERRGFELNADITRKLETLSKNHDATLFMTLLALLNVFLSRLADREDISVGTPVSGRRHQDLFQIIGVFVNTLVLRHFPFWDLTFSRFLGQVRQNSLRALENQEFPFEDLVEQTVSFRDTSRNPLFDVMFIFHSMESPDAGRESDGEEKTAVIPQLEYKTSKVDLTLIVTQLEDRIQCVFEYCTALFSESTVQNFIGSFKQVVHQVLENWERKIGHIDMIPRQERQRLMALLNRNSVSYPREETITDLFQRQAEASLNRIALVGDEEMLTYGCLESVSGQLAGRLRAEGVSRGDIVVLLPSRSVRMVTAVFGILRSGAVCLPIDARHPEERVSTILGESGAEYFLETDKGTIPASLEGKRIRMSGEAESGFEPVPVTGEAHEWAFVIYTSGSTGLPKGTPLDHRGVNNHTFTKIRETGMEEGDVLCHSLSVSFVASIWQYFAPLFVGARLAVFPDDVIRDPFLFFDRLERFMISVAEIVPTFLGSYLGLLDGSESGFRCPHLRLLILTGEKVPPALVREFYKHYRIPLLNAYGQTECSDDTLHYRIPMDPGARSVPVGYPANNTGVGILGRSGRFQPPGVAGELYIDGDGVSVGYLNNPELTAEKFPVNPFVPQRRIFRTGDLARLLPGGMVEVLGRVDNQVKIRGFRVELGEIENALLELDSVQGAVVTRRNDRGDDYYLCAYVVKTDSEEETTCGESGISGLRRALSRKLPAYMIPAFFVFLKRIPINANGKVDKPALPIPQFNNEEEIEGPANDTEETLVKIWAEVLDLPPAAVSVDADFFELGGHSLKVVKMITRIHRAMQVRVPVGTVFCFPTIRALAGYIDRSAAVRYEAVRSQEKKEYYQLSSAQKRIYVLHLMDSTGRAFNIPRIWNLEEPIDSSRLAHCFQLLLARHESLRTGFEVVEGEVVQRIHDNVVFDLTNQNLADRHLRGEIHRDAVNELLQNFSTPFDLGKAPLLRVCLVKISASAHLLMAELHHIICDGLSLNIVIRDFSELLRGKAPAPLAVQYKDYAEWQNRRRWRGALDMQEKYWLRQFEVQPPQPDLPADYTGPEVQSFEGGSRFFALPERTSRALKKIAVSQGVTMHMLLLAAFSILISKLGRREDIVVGVPVAGREHIELENVIGMFVNMLPIRSFPLGIKTFANYLGEVKQAFIDALENQFYQFDDLVAKLDIETDRGRQPLFNVVFAVQDTAEGGGDDPTGAAAEDTDTYTLKSDITRFDMAVLCVQGEKRLHFSWEYSSALFKEETIGRFFGYFEDILGVVAENLDIPLKDIDVSYDLAALEPDIPRIEFGL